MSRQSARSVIAIAVAVTAILLLLADRYGFHRDELYFVVAGQHPAWGYDDQPPLTPILSTIGVALFGATPIALRILPALVVGACTLIAAAMARDMGGGRRAQEAAATTVALSGLLLAGHLASTATYDALAWVITTWLAVRLLAGADPRLWLFVGLAVGVALLNKTTAALLPATLVAGLVVDRRWAVFRSPWPWAGALLALALWSPNMLWQAAHGFPQLEMARHIAAASGAEDRAQFAFVLIILTGPLLWPVLLIGVVWLLVTRAARPWRPLAWAYLIAVALTYAQSGKAYYVMGFVPVLFAAGSVPVGSWLEHGRRRLRAGLFAAIAAVSGATLAVFALPIVPADQLHASGLDTANKESAEQVGWPQLVDAVASVTAGLSPGERARAAIITANYGEAGAIELLGRDLPPVYSGHNSYWEWGPPPDGTTVVILVGRIGAPGVGDCRLEARVDNGLGVRNEEQGAPITVCRQMPSSWSAVWPEYRHLD